MAPSMAMYRASAKLRRYTTTSELEIEVQSARNDLSAGGAFPGAGVSDRRHRDVVEVRIDVGTVIAGPVHPGDVAVEGERLAGAIPLDAERELLGRVVVEDQEAAGDRHRRLESQRRSDREDDVRAGDLVDVYF